MSFDISSRMRAIATNAIREARIAKQIDQGPWLDDHAKRLDIIFNILTDLVATFDVEVEHYPLVVEKQPEQDSRLAKVSEILDNIAATESFPVKLSISDPVEFKVEENTPAFKIPKAVDKK